MDTPSNSYNIHYPDGTIEENVTLVGNLKQVGEVIVRSTGRWVVAELLGLPKDAGGVFELYVKHAPAGLARAARSRRVSVREHDAPVLVPERPVVDVLDLAARRNLTDRVAARGSKGQRPSVEQALRSARPFFVAGSSSSGIDGRT
jgi:hypothetical protein